MRSIKAALILLAIVILISRIYCFNPSSPDDYPPKYKGPDFGPLRRPPKALKDPIRKQQHS